MLDVPRGDDDDDDNNGDDNNDDDDIAGAEAVWFTVTQCYKKLLFRQQMWKCFFGLK